MSKNTVIYIHQSFWGEVNHGHGMIATSLKDNALNQELSSFTDRPGSTYGLDMPSYFSGKKIGEYFIFTRTYQDSLSSRPGMVFTHALIFDINDILNIDNISFVFGLFSEDIPDPTERNTELNVIEHKYLDSQTDSFKYSKYIQTALQSLLSDRLPIIFSGKESNFTKLLQVIWKGALPSIRSKIKFQIGFCSNDIQPNNDFTIIYVHEKFLDKWITFPVINDTDDNKVELKSDEERLLLGDIESNKLHSFIEDLSINLNSFKLITIIHRAFNYYKKLKECTISESLQLIRTIAKFSPSANASNIKSEAIDRLAILLPTASENEIKGLRNIDFSLFVNGKIKVENGIEVYLKNQFNSVNTDYDSFASFLCEIFEENEDICWWHDIIINKVSSIIRRLSNYSVVWKLFLSNYKLLKFFEPYIDRSFDKEKLLLSTYPQVTDLRVVKEINRFANSRKWYRLYATSNLDIFNVQESLLEQIKIEKELELHSPYSGLDIILTKISDTEFIKLAVNTNNDKFNIIAGEKCIDKPQLLSEMDINNSVWLDIWAYSLSKTKTISLGISNPKDIVYSIFNQMIEGVQIPDAILANISISEYSNIKDYPNRKILWDKIPTIYVSSILIKTSNAIIEPILSGNDERDIEAIIERQILSHNFMDRICHGKSLKSILFIYDNFPSLNESYLLKAIDDYYNNNIDILDSEKLGILAEKNRWKNIAEKILDKAKYNNSYRPALNKCSSLISWWNKLLNNHLFNDKITEQDYFKLLIELAVILYEKGPEDNDVWKRAGGDISILSNKDSRREQWHSAIDKLRIGGGGKEITPLSLLKEMKKDYSYKYYTEMNKLIEYFNRK